MSKLRSFQRHLNPSKVWLANQVAEEKIKIARQVVLERAKKDAAFAADVHKAVGDALPKEIKEACEESVKTSQSAPQMIDKNGLPTNAAYFNPPEGGLKFMEKQREEWEKNQPIVGGDTTYKLTEVVQLDGGGTMLVDPNEQIMDGPDSAELPEKLVQMDGPKAEKA